jgi:hypothetical protein
LRPYRAALIALPSHNALSRGRFARTHRPPRAASRRGHKKENKNPQDFYSLPTSSPTNKPQKFPLHIFAYCVIL